MADTLYSAVVKDVQPYVPNCPHPMIVDALRGAAVELCRTAEVYKYMPAEIPIVIAQNAYTPVIPDGTKIIKYVLFRLNESDLGFSPWERVVNSDDQFPGVAADTGTPALFTFGDPNTIYVYPTPDTLLDVGIITDVRLAPTDTSTGLDSVVMDEYRETIVDGAIRRLAGIPNKTWTDMQLSSLRGNLFRRGVTDAYHRAHTSNSATDQRVQLRKFI
jgi:hypothetical protein